MKWRSTQKDQNRLDVIPSLKQSMLNIECTLMQLNNRIIGIEHHASGQGDRCYGIERRLDALEEKHKKRCPKCKQPLPSAV